MNWRWGLGNEEGAGCSHFKWRGPGSLTKTWERLEEEGRPSRQRGSRFRTPGREKHTGSVKGILYFICSRVSTLIHIVVVVPTLLKCLLFLVTSNYDAFPNAENNVVYKTIYYGMSRDPEDLLAFDLKRGKFSVCEMESSPRCYLWGKKQALYRIVSAVPLCVGKGEK